MEDRRIISFHYFVRLSFISNTKNTKECNEIEKKNYLVVLHCVKYPRMWAFSDPHLPMYGQNRIRIFPYMDRIIDSYQEALKYPDMTTN